MGKKTIEGVTTAGAARSGDLVQQPKDEIIMLGDLEAHKIKWSTRKGPSFVILLKDRSCVIQIKSQNYTSRDYDPSLIPEADEIAMTFRKQQL